MSDFDLFDVNRRMDSAVEVLHKEFSGLRTGRASATLLEPVMVDAYGSSTPIPQVGTISVPEPRMLTVQVWDQSLVQAVEKAINDADLGLNPMSEGQLVRVPIPDLSEERRVEITKIAHKYTELARVSVRNVRRDAMDKLKKMEKDGDLSQDAHHDKADEVQKLTDIHTASIDELLRVKEKEVMQV
jgi:ribosome recycling factor